MLTSNGHTDKPSFSQETEGGLPAADAAQETRRLGAFLEQKAEQATRAVGAGMESLGNVIQQHEPSEGYTMLVLWGKMMLDQVSTTCRWMFA